MTLQTNGPISLAQIAAEFGLSANARFPDAFYGLGGAPASGALAFADFYGRSAVVSDFAIGNETDAPIGSTGRRRYQRTLTAQPVGTGPFTYAWAESEQTGENLLSLDSQSGTTIRATSSWAQDGSDGFGASAKVTLTITDTSNSTTKTVSHVVSL